MSHSDNGGFTMIELMFVIGLLGVILLITAPQMSRFVNSSRLAGATNVLTCDLRYARSLATSQRRNYEFRGTTTGYSVVCTSPMNTVLTRALHDGVTFTAQDTATFFAWGLTETKVLTLQNDNRSRIVRMSAAGQVTRD